MFNKFKQKASEIFGRLFGTRAQDMRKLLTNEPVYRWKSTPPSLFKGLPNTRFWRRVFKQKGETYNVGMNAAKRQADSYARNNKQKRANRSALRRGIAGVLAAKAA